MRKAALSRSRYRPGEAGRHHDSNRQLLGTWVDEASGGNGEIGGGPRWGLQKGEQEEGMSITRQERDRWAAVLERDSSCDGTFYYAVRTTGIFCRPSCPARRPNREHITYFETPSAAEDAGFRPCKRCRPTSPAASRSEAAVRHAQRYLDEHLEERVSLRDLAREVELSPHHLHRTFKRLVGLTPKAYQDAKRMERLKSELQRGATVSRATFEVGFGSSRALYEKADSGLGMTPGQYRRGGRGVTIRYTARETRFGTVLMAATERGICAVDLGDCVEDLLEALRADFPEATFRTDDASLTPWMDEITTQLDGADTGPGAATQLPTDLKGTEFQLRVWRALQEIPFGTTRSYGQVARAIGRPTAARAVAGACARNRTALLVPCHRVVRADGDTGGFRWGPELKKRLLERERQLSRNR